MILVIITLKFRSLKSKKGAKLPKKKLVFNFRGNETKHCFLVWTYQNNVTCSLIYEVQPFWKKNLIHKFFFVLSSVSFVPLVRFLGIHVSYLNYFKSFSVPAIFTHFSLDKNKQPLLAISHKVNFQITIF